MKTASACLVESVKDYAIIMLDPGGHVASWNAGAEHFKGYRADEIIGKHFSCFYPPEAIQRGLPEQELKAAAKDGRFEDEGWRVRKDGKQFWANVIISALRDQDGTLRGFSKVTRDLTERKQAEERIKQQSKEIMELSTPVMQVWQGVVVAPLIGSLDSNAHPAVHGAAARAASWKPIPPWRSWTSWACRPLTRRRRSTSSKPSAPSACSARRWC